MQKIRNNHSWLDKIQSTQLLKHLPFLGLGVLSWLGFSYLFTLYIKILQGGSLNNFPWHYDAPIFAFQDSLVGAAIIIGTRWIFSLLSEKSKSVGIDCLILMSLIPLTAFLMNAFSILVFGASYTGKKTPDNYDWVMGFLHGLILQIFVGFTCIGYFYLTLVNKTKERLLRIQRAKSEMELKNLQQNIEPHFLFNNLNVLSSLIESNPNKANDFLSKLAELYRYILKTQSVECVPIKQEIEFARNYIFLLKERFGKAYKFDWQINENKLNGQMIVPIALQSLIENTVKHNAGSNENPLLIFIKLEDDYLSVENQIRKKSLTFQTNKSGLNNLQSRYTFLTNKSIEITQSDIFFKVKLPLIETK